MWSRLKAHFINRVINCERGGGGGDSNDAPKVEKVDPLQQARANLQAQLETMPQAAKLQYDIAADPETGLGATTQLYENVRKNVFPNETAVRNQLVQNVLSQLISPTGYTEGQQSALDQRRDQAVERAQRAQRTRANLGGNLYGGRSQAAEQQDINNLVNQFSVEDINMQERQRLNNAQLALAVMQMLYPQSGIQNPNFVNPVASADTQYGGAVNQANTQAQLEAQKREQDVALQSALWQSLGEAIPDISLVSTG